LRLPGIRQIGGSGIDQPFAIAVDSVGAAYVTGFTASPDFPVLNGSPGGGLPYITQSFVLKLSPDGSKLLYSTLIAPVGTTAIAVDSARCAG
jgi:hypothetical protein